MMPSMFFRRGCVGLAFAVVWMLQSATACSQVVYKPTPAKVYSKPSLAEVCHKLPSIDSTWRWRKGEWLDILLPAHIAKSVDRSGGIGLDDQIFDVPPMGYTLMAEPGVAGLISPDFSGARALKAFKDGDPKPVRCQTLMTPSGPVKIVVRMSQREAPMIYHIFAHWDSTSARPAFGAIGRSRDLAGARAIVRALSQGRIHPDTLETTSDGRSRDSTSAR